MSVFFCYLFLLLLLLLLCVRRRHYLLLSKSIASQFHQPFQKKNLQEPMCEPTKEKLESFKNSKYFQNERFWIIDLVRYEKPVRTSRVIHFERYRDGKVVLRSDVLHNLFNTSKGPWDEIIIVEYANTKDFVSKCGSSTSHLQAREMIAVSSPRVLGENVDLFGSRRVLDEAWTVRRKNHFANEKQEIQPELENLSRMFSDKSEGWRRGRERPLWAINLLRFVRQNNFDGRSEYYKYGQVAQKVISSGTVKKRALKGDGAIVAPSIAFTLLGPIEWDEFVVMGYANLKSFMGLQRNKAWKKAEESFRKKGLLKQGLLMVSPQSSRENSRL